MNILDQIKQCKDKLTPRELEIYKIVMEHPYEISSSTTSQIVAHYHVSQSSISRFCQKVGYNSYSDFRMALFLSATTGRFHEESEGERQDLTYYMCDLVKAVRKSLPDTLLDTLSKRVMTSNTIYTAGTTYSSIPAQLLALQFLLGSFPAHYVPAGSEVEVLHITRPSDTFFLFSVENPTHQDFLTSVREISPEKRPYTILVTLSARHPLQKLADQVVYLPSWTSMHYPIAVDTSFVTNTFCNIFSNYLMTLVNTEKDSSST